MAFQYVLPRGVASQLDRLRSRLRQVAVLRGVGVTLILAVVSFVAVMGADWWVDFEPSTRLTLLGSWAAGLLVASLALIARPATRRMNDVELAAYAEQQFPDLGERLVTLIELGDQSVPESQRGSALMREMLEAQTVRRVEQYDFEQSVPSSGAMRYFSVGLGLMGLLVMSLILFPSVSGTLFARVVNPWGNYESVSRLTFEVVDGDRVVARGSDVELNARIKWKSGSEEPIPEPVTLQLRMANGDADTRELRFDPDTSAFTTTVPKAFESFEFIVSADGSRSKRHQVQVVEAPVVTEAKLEIVAPGYVGEPRRVVDGIVGEITAFERSQLRFDLTFNKPVKSAEIEWMAPAVVRGSSYDKTQKEEVAAVPARRVGPLSNELLTIKEILPTELKLSADGLHASLEIPAEVQSAFAFRLKDEYGLGNEEPFRHLLITLDQPPTIEMPGAARDEARPTDVVAVTAQITDDFAIGDVQLHVASDKGLQKVIEVDVGKLGQKSLNEEFRLDLADLGVKAGEVLTIQLRARDERPLPEPNEVWSPERVIILKEDATAPGAKDVLARQAEIRKELAAIRQELANEAKQANELKDAAQKAADANKPLNERPKLEQLADAELAAAERLKDLAEQFKEHPLFANLAPQAEQLAEKNIEAPANNLELAAGEEPKQVAQELQANANKINEARDKLGEMQKRFDDLAQLERDLLEVNRLAQRANQLADDAAKLEERRQELAAEQKLDGDSPEAQQAKQDQLAEDQAKLKQEQEDLLAGLNDLLEKRPELLEAARDHQLNKLADLAERARELAQPQEALADAVQEKAEQLADAAKPVLEKQQELAQQAEKLAAQAADQQARQPVAPIDPELARQIVEQLKQGNLEAAEQLAKESAEDLERLAKELLENNPLPADPKEAAKELARRQREIADQIDRARAAAEAGKDQPQAAQQNNQPQNNQQANAQNPGNNQPMNEQPNGAAQNPQQPQAQPQPQADPNAPNAARNEAQPPSVRELAARQAALELAAAQLNLDRESRDEQQAAVNRAADAVQDLVAAERAAQQANQANQQAAQQPNQLAGQQPQNNAQQNPNGPMPNAQQGENNAQPMNNPANNAQNPPANENAARNADEQLQRLERAAEDAREAAEALDRLAEVAQPNANNEGNPAPQEAARNAQQAAERIAEQQRELREQTERLNNENNPARPNANAQANANPQQAANPAQNQPANAGQQPNQPNEANQNNQNQNAQQNGAQPQANPQANEAAQQLADRQQGLREQAEQLPNNVAPLPRAEALDRLEQAEEALEQGRLNEAAAAQREAEQALEAFARQAGARANQPMNPANGNEAGQPGNNNAEQLAEQAQQLAQAQRELQAALEQLENEQRGGMPPAGNQNPNQPNQEQANAAAQQGNPAGENAQDRLFENT